MEEKINLKHESFNQNINLEKIGSILKATYIDTLPSGHMGSNIYRFKRLSDKVNLIVKQALKSNAPAIKDIEANVFAYQKIKEIGGEEIIVPELGQIDIPETRTLAMKDLGETFRKVNSTKEDYEKLWNNFDGLISKTISNSKPLDANIYANEIISHMQQYMPAEIDMLTKIRNSSEALAIEGKAAIMLLDFTPDNVFLVEDRMFFIDPWKQETYLGHPAVSIGQFTTLVELYNMADSESNTKILIEKCFERLPKLLGCNKDSIEFALKLGSTLQLVLSAYVRQESNPNKSRELIELARKKW